jgi:hypothetical protein
VTEAETVDALLPPRSGLVVAGPPGRQGRGNRRGVALVSSAHVAHDLYQGAVPAMLPFLVAERHYGYAAVAGLTLAATFLSSGAQPVSGICFSDAVRFSWVTERLLRACSSRFWAAPRVARKVETCAIAASRLVVCAAKSLPGPGPCDIGVLHFARPASCVAHRTHPLPGT